MHRLSLLALLFLFLPRADAAVATQVAAPLAKACVSNAQNLKSLHAVLDENPLPEGTLSKRATAWTRRARLFVAKLDAPAATKVRAMRTLFDAIADRVVKEAPGTYTPLDWKLVEVEVGGTTLFIGGIGHFVEIRPDGSLYKGIINPIKTDRSVFFSPDWKPKGGSEGLDPSYLLERTRVE